MDIEDLQTFVAVADAGGVSAAARRLGVSKSIVSRRLFRIEAELGVQLLARTTRGAALTEAGITFRDHAARASAEIDTARETILPTGELRGRLRVAMPLSFGPTHFAPVLAEMAHQHPQLQIHTSYSDRFVDLIAEGFDCAIRVGYLQDSNLIAKRIGPIYGNARRKPGLYQKRTVHPRRRMNSSPMRRSCRERKPGSSWMATRSSRFSRRAGSRPTTLRRSPPPRRQGSASPGSPIASHMNMWPPARSFRS